MNRSGQAFFRGVANLPGRPVHEYCGCESVTVSVWASVLAFVTWSYEQYEAEDAG
jgi:hypothetical protein